MRKEAITHMERAIESCKIRMDQEQRSLDENSSAMGEDKATAAKTKIANIKEIVGDMEQRVSSAILPYYTLAYCPSLLIYASRQSQ